MTTSNSPQVQQSLLDQVKAAISGREADIIMRLLPDGINRGKERLALNPSRQDLHLGSFSACLTGPRAGLYHDFASGDSGDLFQLVRLATGADFTGALRYLARECGIKVQDPRLTIRRSPEGVIAEWKRRVAAGISRGRGCTISDLATAKSLSPQFLADLGLYDLPERPANGERQALPTAVEIPYRDASGHCIATRLRSDLIANQGSFWKPGTKPTLYGLERLTGTESQIHLVEGESSCWVLWHAGIAAIGIPGAYLWRDEWIELLPASAEITLLRDPDAAGAALAVQLMKSPLAARLKIKALQVKDAADAWVADPNLERFRATIAAAIEVTEVQEDEPVKPLAITLRTHSDRERDRTTPGPMIIGDLLPEGGIGACIALPGVGKTLVAIALAQCVASGTDFAGHRTTSGAVLYFCPDAPASSERRMLAIPAETAARILTVTDAPQLPGGLPELKDAIERASVALVEPVRLVVLDTWDAIREHSAGGYSDQDGTAEAILRGLRSIAMELRLAFLIVHHATRSDASRVRGTVVFDARCDWIAVVETTDAGLLLKSIKCRDGEHGPLGSWTIATAAVGDRPVPVLVASTTTASPVVLSPDDRVFSIIWGMQSRGERPTARGIAQAAGMGTGSLSRITDRLRAKGALEASGYILTAFGLSAGAVFHRGADIHCGQAVRADIDADSALADSMDSQENTGVRRGQECGQNSSTPETVRTSPCIYRGRVRTKAGHGDVIDPTEDQFRSIGQQGGDDELLALEDEVAP